MPKSTRHKSSKHKDAREYSDSEKESNVKEKKTKDESSVKEKKTKDESSVRITKDSGDKRKLDSSKDYYDEEHSSSKRRKGRSGDNGKDDEKGESSKKSKASSEKSKRREDGEGDETKKRSDGKHRESSRRETKESDKDKDRERARKHKESKSDKFYDSEDHHKSKDRTESKAQDHVRSPGSENYTEKRSRRKRDDHTTGDKHQDNSDKYQEDKEEDIKEKGDKHKDDRPTKEHSRYDAKLLRNESKKKSKSQDNDRGHEPDSEFDGYHEHERNRDYERESKRNERDRDRDYERDRDRDRDRERDRDRRDYEHDRYRERDWDGERSRDRDSDRDRTHDREKDRSRDYHHDRKRSKSDRERDNDPDDESGGYKERKEGRRSPDYQDYQEVIMGTRSSRAEPDSDMMRSERQPSSSVVREENRTVIDQKIRGVSSREAAELSGGSERGSRQKVYEKTAKMEKGVLGEFPAERSFAAKASPQPMVERSPSSTSLDRRYNNRSGGRRNLEGEETGHRNNARDFSAAKIERHLVDETSQAELCFNNKSNHNNASFPPRPESRSGISSPRVGPREEDNRVNTGGRYKRGVDSMMGRGQGNVWRGVPSWPSPLPNGFIPFQHIPPHGGFQTMMPQFPSPSLFGVRPSMEMSHPGIPFHIPDAERFSGHLRPLGWQNMMDGSAASHLQGFFGDASAFRDDSNMHGGSEWDHNKRMHGRGWESGADEWKTGNGDASTEFPSMSIKDDNSAQVADDESLGDQTSQSENNRAKSIEAGSNLTSSAKGASSPKSMAGDAGENPVTELSYSSERYCRHYLSKLDISVELADPELRECISLVMGEERLTTDDGVAVFVSLKDGGKRVPKSNTTSLKTPSLLTSQNTSVFQIAMDLYKEQRFEVNGLPKVKWQEESSQVSPSHLVKVENNDDVSGAMKGSSSIEASDVKIADVSDSATSQKELQEVPSHVGAEMEIETQDEASPSLDKSPEAVGSDHNGEYEHDAETEDGASVEQTMETSAEHDSVPEGGDPVTSIIAAPAPPVSMEVCEQKDMPEDTNMEVIEEKEDDDGDKGVAVGVSPKVTEALVNESESPKVTEALVNESDESVISRIHLSPQSTH